MNKSQIAIRAVLILLVVVVLTAIVLVTRGGDRAPMTTTDKPETTRSLLPDPWNAEQQFLRDGLKTDTTKANIPLNKILSGGPPKDGIPSIDDPNFTAIENASRSITDDTFGILVTVGETTRFYPFNILVWHEIVNDSIEGRPLAVTFCPLCGSSIVYDATIDGEVFEFGVSGKLFESNLLMYDRKTETLWSQARGEAVVGELLGRKLEIYPAQMLSFAAVKEQYPEAEILSDRTGHFRNYSGNPYGNYDENDTLIFPVSREDVRYPLKEIMYVVPFENHSLAFPIKDIPTDSVISVDVSGTRVEARQKNGEYQVSPEGSGEFLPGYFEMWFSWVQHHEEDGIVWTE